MSDHWYYADNEHPVGPLNLHQLKNALQELPNLKEVLVWREGFSDWRKAADISELDGLDATSPPIPVTQATVDWSLTERTAGSEKATAFPAKIAFLIISYFAAALAITVFFELREPFTTWASLAAFEGVWPFMLGKAIGLFLVSGVIPIVWWAFARFRAKKASGPLLLWFLLIAFLGYYTNIGKNYELESELEKLGKTGFSEEYRQDGIAMMERGCISKSQQDPLTRMANITDAQISAYCDCYANNLWDELTPDEISYYVKEKKPSAVMQKKMDELMPICVEAALGN